MEEINRKIEGYANEHLSSKKTFCNIDFNRISLNRVAKSELVEEYFELNNHELIAIKKIFEFIFEDFESDPENRELWETIYTFPVENDIQYLRDNFLDNRKQIEIINTSKTDSRVFLNALLNRAISSKNNTFNEVANSNRSKFFVVGDIGVGKTTFFKYLFSTYFEKVKKSNCFYLHIDFSIEFYQKLSISESIKHEASRMFRLYYYDGLSEQKKSELKVFLREYYVDDPVKLESDYLSFSVKPDPQDFKPYSNQFQKGLINFIERNYGVLYILDGLDKLNSLEEFQEKYEEVNTILSTPRRKGLFLFVMRYDSHESFHKSYLDNMNLAEKARPFGKVFKIEEAKLNNIINNRLNLLIKNWQNVVNENKSDIFNNIASEENEIISQKAAELSQKFSNFITIDGIKSYFNIFLIFLHHGIDLDEEMNFDSWDQKTSITELKNLIGNNFRNLMDAINLVHEVFLSEISALQLCIEDIIEIFNQVTDLGNEFLTKDSSYSDKFKILINRSYKVIPLLLKARNSYLHPFYYQYSALKSELVRKGNYDPSKFLYNIFYPINSIDNEEQQYTILLKIRIIQLLKLLEDEQQIISDKDQLCTVFKLYFHYDYHYIYLAVEELFLTRLIRFDIKEYGYSIIASRTGLNHINNLILNFGYYRIILSDTLIPIGFDKAFVDPNPELFKSNRGLWILSQIPRISLFVLLLKCVESREFDQRPNKKLKFPNITDSILNSLINSSKKICGAHDKELNKIETAFKIMKSKIP